MLFPVNSKVMEEGKHDYRRVLPTNFRTVLISGGLGRKQREKGEDEWRFSHLKSERGWKQIQCIAPSRDGCQVSVSLFSGCFVIFRKEFILFLWGINSEVELLSQHLIIFGVFRLFAFHDGLC